MPVHGPFERDAHAGRGRRSRAGAGSARPEAGVNARRERALAALAARQRGVVHRVQLVRLGFTRSAIEHRLATGRLIRLHGNVYAVGHGALPPLARETAALLSIGPDAVLSHRSGAVVSGLLAPIEGAPVDVTVVDRNPGRRQGIRIHRTARLPADDVQRRSGLRVTRPIRTLMDLAATGSTADVERAVAEAQLLRLVTEDELSAAVSASAGSRGVARIRRILDDDTAAPTRSEAERAVRALVRRARLPVPRSNVVVAGHEVDLLWPEQRLVVEVDGFEVHRRRKTFERDRSRDADLLLAGYRVLRLTWRQVRTEPEAVAARLAAALALALAPPAPVPPPGRRVIAALQVAAPLGAVAGTQAAAPLRAPARLRAAGSARAEV